MRKAAYRHYKLEQQRKKGKDVVEDESEDREKNGDDGEDTGNKDDEGEGEGEPEGEGEGEGEGEPEIEGEGEKEPEVRIMRDLGMPTRKEVQEHRIFHIPYRSWCPHCVRGRGKEDHHRKVDRSDQVHSLISIDYAFTNGKRKEDVDIDNEIRDGGAVLIVHDARSKTTYAHPVPAKGPGDGWVIEKVHDDVENLGYTTITLRSDQEPSIIRL